MEERIERELTLPAGTDEVWEAVTGPGWLADEVDLDLRPGGEASFRTGDSVKIGWVEDAIIPDDSRDPGRLVYWWATEGELATRVELTIEPDAWLGARLRVIESRPLAVLNLVGGEIGRRSDRARGPAMLAA